MKRNVKQRNTQHEINRQLLELPSLDRISLQELWTNLFGQPPHPKLRREVLLPILAYRIQEKAYGGLKPATLRRLEQLGRGIATNKTKPASSCRLKPGAKLVREWQGQLHEVSVLESGFEYREKSYRSLTEIANLITGAHWSGPLFFGLKRRSKTEAD